MTLKNILHDKVFAKFANFLHSVIRFGVTTGDGGRGGEDPVTTCGSVQLVEGVGFCIREINHP